MKHGRKPTVKQKIFLKDHRLNPENWLVVEDDKFHITVVHRNTDTMKKIDKEMK